MSKLLFMLIFSCIIHLGKSKNLFYICEDNNSTTITMKSDTGVEVDASKLFDIRYGTPCDPPIDVDDEKWEIKEVMITLIILLNANNYIIFSFYYQNGLLTLYYEDKITLFPNTGYCFDTEGQLPCVCMSSAINGTKNENESTFHYYYLKALYISLPFGILSFLIYLQVPEFKKLHVIFFINSNWKLFLLILLCF